MKKQNKIRYLLPAILLIIGIMILLYPKISNYLASKNQGEAIRTYNEDTYNMNEEKKNLEYENAKKYNECLASGQSFSIEYEDLLNISKAGIMAYIEIPKISVYLPIYHGTGRDVLNKGVGHVENTSLPVGGKSTHCVLSGHTGLVKSLIFTRLNELDVGDYFYINVLNQKLTYKVYKTEVVLPENLESLQIVTEQDLVTLVTCTPYGINTHRLLVHGVREEIDNENSENIKIGQENLKIIKLSIVQIIIIICFCCIFIYYIVKYIMKNKKHKK